MNHEHPITKKTSRNKLKQPGQLPMPTWCHHRGGSDFYLTQSALHMAFCTGIRSWGKVTNTKYQINYLFCYLWKYKKVGKFFVLLHPAKCNHFHSNVQ